MKNPFIVASALIIPILVATAQDTDKSKWKEIETLAEEQWLKANNPESIIDV